MAKCEKCGRGGMGVLHQAIKLKDKKMICFKCAKLLGMSTKLSDLTLYPLMYTWDEVKDGMDAYYERRRKQKVKDEVLSSISVTMGNYGQERELNATEEENEIFFIIRSLCDDYGFDSEQLRLVRVSDSYVTAKAGEWDLARFKYTPRAKWIMFPSYEAKQVKHYIQDYEEVADMVEYIHASIDVIRKFL